MNRIIILIILSVNVNLLQAQWLCSGYLMTFEDTFCRPNLRIDTTNSNNIWQIGSPQKSIFTSAYSPQRVIVTDTLNSYPVNNNSSFTLVNLAGPGFTFPHIVGLAGYYKADTDSLNDYGLIEFSPDNGVTWIDLINDTIYNSYYEWGPAWDPHVPVLTGKTTEWQRFTILLGSLGPVFNIQDGDTVLYKFTFVSDSVSDSRDGLMFDDLDYADFIMGIENPDFKQINSTVYPNPANQNLTIEFTNSTHSDFTLMVYDNSGRQVYEVPYINTTKHKLSTEGFENGFYYYSLINIADRQQSIGTFIIEK